jgi:hypothetical protein
MTWIVEADHGPEDGCEIVGVFEAERDAIKCMVGEERAKTKRWYGPEYSVNEWHGRRQIPCVWWYVETNMNNEVVLKLCEYGESTEWIIERKHHEELFIGGAIEFQTKAETKIQTGEWITSTEDGYANSLGFFPDDLSRVIGRAETDEVDGEVWVKLIGGVLPLQTMSLEEWINIPDTIKLKTAPKSIAVNIEDYDQKAIIGTADEDTNAGGTAKVNLNV